MHPSDATTKKRWDERHSAVAGKLRRPSEGLRLRARELRDAGTSAEGVLWACLRNKGLGGLKFRRQHAIGPFTADFYCDEAQLVVELDGPAHQGQGERDRVRDHWMEQHGLRVLRVGNAEVLSDPDGVLERILAYALTPGPSP